MQPGADVVGCVGIALTLVARDQHSACHHAGDTGQPNPLPYASHATSLPKLRAVKESTVSLQRALDETRTGDIWLFRGSSGPDRAIQTMSNSPVNHVGMTIAIEDLPPLIWHAELGDKLTDMWTGGNHRGVQLHDARQAIERWMNNYHQRCWLRELTPYATREQEDRALKVVARMDGTPFPTTARLTGRWFRGRLATRRLHAGNSARAQQGS